AARGRRPLPPLVGTAAMPLSGTFSTMPFPDLLQWISDARRAGQLSVTLEFEERLLQFEGGNITQVESDDPRAHDLAELLRSRGLLDEAELQRAAEAQARTGQALYEVASVMKPAVREKIGEAARDHSVQTVLGLFLWRDGRFHFSDGDGPAPPINLAPRRPA